MNLSGRLIFSNNPIRSASSARQIRLSQMIFQYDKVFRIEMGSRGTQRRIALRGEKPFRYEAFSNSRAADCPQRGNSISCKLSDCSSEHFKKYWSQDSVSARRISCSAWAAENPVRIETTPHICMTGALRGSRDPEHTIAVALGDDGKASLESGKLDGASKGIGQPFGSVAQ